MGDYDRSKEFQIILSALLDQKKSKNQLNEDIKSLEKVVNSLRLTATFAKSDTKKELNTYIKQLSNQLSTLKLKAKFDSKNLNRELNSALSNIKFVDIDALDIDENKFKLKLRKVIGDTKSYVGRISIPVNIHLKKDKLNNDLTTYLGKYSKIKESSVLLEEADKVRNLIDAINDKKSLREATDAFQLFKSEVSATGFTSKSTTEKIKGMLSNITKISSIFGVASFAINNFTKSIQTLKGNDTILTEISKTSEMTKQQLKELGDEAFKVASKYGQLSPNYLLSVQEMARSGYESTSKELGKLSLLAQSAGDMTAENANNYLLATDAAYKYSGSIEKLNSALDGANYISNKNSTSLTDLADGIRVSASFAANAGIAIDELTAAEGTMIATTKRSGSEMGRAFRSIILSLQKVSGEFDGEVIDEEQLKKVESRCHSLGVELEYLKDGVATLRNPMEILKDLADVYNSLPDNSAEKQGLISDIGGRYHANALSALLSRWDLYEKMLSEYSQGAGSALEEANKTADSWEGRLNSLKNSWDSFVNLLTNKQAIMGGVSLFDRLIQGAETLTDAVGEIPVLLTTLNTAMTSLNKDYGITQLVNPETNKFDIQGNLFGIDFTAIKTQQKHFKDARGAIKAWNKELNVGKTDLESFNFDVVKNNAQLKDYLSTCSKDAPASLNGYKSYLNAAGVSTDALRLKTVLLNAAIGMGIGLAIQGIVKAIDNYAHASENARKASAELTNGYTQEKQTLDDSISKYKELQSQLHDNSLSTSEVKSIKEQLLSIQDDLNQKYGAEATQIDLVNGKYDEQIAKLEKLSKEKAKDFVAENYNNNKEDQKYVTGNYNIGTNIGKYTLDSYTSAPDFNKDMGFDIQKYMKKYKNLSLTMFDSSGVGSLAGDIQLVGNGTREELYNQLSDLLNDLSNDFGESNKSVNNFKSAISGILEKSFDTEEIDNAKQRIKDYAESQILAGDESAKTYNNLVNAINNYNTALESGKGVDEAKAKLLEAKTSAEQASEGIANAGDVFQDVYNSISDSAPLELKIQFGTTSEDLSKTYNDLLNRLIPSRGSTLGITSVTKNALSGVDTNVIEQWVGSLSEEEANIANSDEFEQALERQKQGLNGAALSAQNYSNALQEVKKSQNDTGNETSIPSIIDSWNSLIDTDEEELKNTRKDLLALAEAGQLTAETFHDTTGADTFLDGISESLPEAIDWINQLVSSSTQLQSMSTQISKMSDMLADKKNGTTASASDLAGFDATVKGLESWEEFERVMGSSKSSMEECQAAANALATEWVNNGNFLANLTEENKDYYITQLDNMGVMNAEALVTDHLSTAQLVAENTKNALSAATADLSDKQESYTKRSIDAVNATYENSTALANQEGMTNAARVALADLVAQQTIFSGDKLDVSDKIAALSELAGAYLGAAAQASFLAKTQGGLNSSYRISAEEAWAQVQDEFSKINTSITPTVKINPSGSSGYKGSSSKKSGSKDSKQTIDWISRLLDVIQKKIDKLKAASGNLFTLKDKKNNLAEQIKLTKNLLTATTIAADRYKKAADKVGLSKELKEKVKNGSYDITEYGSKTAEKIQKYQSYLDSYNDLIQQEEELRTNIRGLKSDDYQLDIDNAEAKISKYETLMDGTSSAEKRISYLKKIRDCIKETYKYQILQAELEGNTVKADQLRAERANELKDNTISQYQERADKADAKIAKSQAYAALDEGNYKAQNKHLEAQKKYTKDYYKAQIQIAKKNGDLIEADRLRAEKQKELNDLSKQEFDNISDTYNKKLQLLDAKAQSINNQIGIVEAKGYVVSADYYNSLTTNTKKNLSELTDELIALRQKRDEMLKDGTLKKGTTAWYEIQSAIWSVKNAQDEATKSLIEYENQIRQLKWDAFDRQEDFISQIQDEGNWLIDLMSNEKLFDDSGNWTEYANATAGLRAVNYNAYMAQADDYEKEIKAIQQEINNDPYNIDLIKRKQELISAQRELIKSANQEQEAIKSLVSDGYDKWLDALQKSIDLRKKELDNVSDLYSYQKKIAELTKNVSTYEKQMISLQFDSSEESVAKRQKISVELQNAKDALQESEYEQWKTDQQKMLDTLADDAQEFVNQRMDNLDALVSDVISATNSNSTAIKDTLEKITSDVGTTLSSDMTKIWNTADGISNVVSDYGDKLSNGITTVGSTLTSIKDYVEKISNASEKPSDINTDDKSFNPVQYSQKQQVSSFIDSHKQEATRERDYYKALNQYIYDATGGYVLSKTDEAALADLLNVNIYSDLTGDAGRIDLERILAALKLTGYAKGGVISSISDAIRLNGDSVLVSANPGERILTAEQNENWEKWTKELPNLVNLTDVIKPNVNIPETINRNVGNNIEKIEMEINLPGVTNYEEFKSNLIRDRQFEKAVQTMTLDRALGGNSLNKYKIR